MSYTKPEVLIHQYSPTSRSGGSPPVYESAATPTPIADFSGSPRTGVAPLTVAFLDASTYEPTSWYWDFQNNGSVDSTYRYPTVIYNTAGSYDVKLTVSNQYGSSTVIKSGYIVVSNPAPSTLFINFNTLGPGGASSSTADYDNGTPAGSLWAGVGITFSTGFNVFPTINAYDDPNPMAYEGAGFLMSRIEYTEILIDSGLNFTQVSFYSNFESSSIVIFYRNGIVRTLFTSGSSYFWSSNTFNSLITESVPGYVISKIGFHSGFSGGNCGIDNLQFS